MNNFKIIYIHHKLVLVKKKNQAKVCQVKFYYAVIVKC